MPTGYTQIIHDKKDVTLKEYALRCARAFGAFVEMRDEPLDKETVDPYYEKGLTDALQKVETLKRQDPRGYGKRIIRDRCEELERSIRNHVKLNARFDVIQNAVHAWVPPSPEHEGLKEFMLSQIQEDRKYEPGVAYYKEEMKKIREADPVKLYERDLRNALTSVTTTRESLQEAKERAASRTKWIRDLVESLKDA